MKAWLSDEFRGQASFQITCKSLCFLKSRQQNAAVCIATTNTPLSLPAGFLKSLQDPHWGRETSRYMNFSGADCTAAVGHPSKANLVTAQCRCAHLPLLKSSFTTAVIHGLSFAICFAAFIFLGEWEENEWVLVQKSSPSVPAWKCCWLGSPHLLCLRFLHKHNLGSGKQSVPWWGHARTGT